MAEIERWRWRRKYSRIWVWISATLAAGFALAAVAKYVIGA